MIWIFRSVQKLLFFFFFLTLTCMKFERGWTALPWRYTGPDALEHLHCATLPGVADGTFFFDVCVCVCARGEQLFHLDSSLWRPPPPQPSVGWVSFSFALPWRLSPAYPDSDSRHWRLTGVSLSNRRRLRAAAVLCAPSLLCFQCNMPWKQSGTTEVLETAEAVCLVDSTDTRFCAFIYICTDWK